jgi:hypothetical protein
MKWLHKRDWCACTARAEALACVTSFSLRMARGPLTRLMSVTTGFGEAPKLGGSGASHFTSMIAELGSPCSCRRCSNAAACTASETQQKQSR